MGFPCCARFPSCTCRRQYPGAATGRRLRSSHPAVSAFPEIAVGSACTSTFSRLARRVTRVAARTLAPSPIRDQLHRRLQPFRHLHDCSGCFRPERSPGGALTHWKAPPSHGARKLRSFIVALLTYHVRPKAALQSTAEASSSSFEACHAEIGGFGPNLCASLDGGGGSLLSETRKIAAILVADVVGYSRLA